MIWVISAGEREVTMCVGGGGEGRERAVGEEI